MRVLLNSVINGGINVIAKSDNTSYSNRFGFNSGEAFETILNYTTATQDNVIMLPNISGTVATTSQLLDNTDITLSGNRIIDVDNNNLRFNNGRFFFNNAVGNHSFNIKSHGNTSGTIAFALENSNAGAASNIFNINDIGDILASGTLALSGGLAPANVIEMFNSTYNIGFTGSALRMESAGDLILKAYGNSIGGLDEVKMVDNIGATKFAFNVSNGSAVVNGSSADWVGNIRPTKHNERISSSPNDYGSKRCNS